MIKQDKEQLLKVLNVLSQHVKSTHEDDLEYEVEQAHDEYQTYTISVKFKESE